MLNCDKDERYFLEVQVPVSKKLYSIDFRERWKALPRLHYSSRTKSKKIFQLKALRTAFFQITVCFFVTKR